MKEIMETLIARDNGKPLNKVDYANTFYKQNKINILVDCFKVSEVLNDKSFVNLCPPWEQTTKN